MVYWYHGIFYQANPLSGCLPALFQIPIFLALYRSFYNLASDGRLNEAFLWLPNLQGPVFGARSTDWLLQNWQINIDAAHWQVTPSLGWTDTLCYLSIPVLLYLAQSLSLKILSPPPSTSNTPEQEAALQRSQQILKYLPIMLSYFSLSVPAGLGVYWVVNNLLSTVTTMSIKTYLKENPSASVKNIDIDSLLGQVQNSGNNPYYYPEWGYK